MHTPLKRVTYQSKPCRSVLLTALRTAYSCGLRCLKCDHCDCALLASARAARSAYFKGIKNAKREYWSSFLASATPQTVWTAKKLAVGGLPPCFGQLRGAITLPELNKALLNHIFLAEPARFFDTIVLHQQKLIQSLRRGRRVRTHPTSFFRHLRPQRPDTIPNTDCGLTSRRTLPTSRLHPTSPALLPPLISRPDFSFPASHLPSIRMPPQGTPFSFCFRGCSYQLAADITLVIPALVPPTTTIVHNLFVSRCFYSSMSTSLLYTCLLYTFIV